MPLKISVCYCMSQAMSSNQNYANSMQSSESGIALFTFLLLLLSLALSLSSFIRSKQTKATLCLIHFPFFSSLIFGTDTTLLPLSHKLTTKNNRRIIGHLNGSLQNIYPVHSFALVCHCHFGVQIAVKMAVHLLSCIDAHSHQQMSLRNFKGKAFFHLICSLYSCSHHSYTICLLHSQNRSSKEGVFLTHNNNRHLACLPFLS